MAPSLWDWLLFGVSITLACYAFAVLVADRIPGLGGASTITRKVTARLFLIFVDRGGAWLITWVYRPLWRALVGLLRALWSGPEPPRQAAPVSSISVPLPANYVAGELRATPQEVQTDRGLSGLSALAGPAPAPDPARAYIETLDIGGRRRAVALLLDDGWRTGQIRKVLTGDNGDIGREVAEARRQLGLADDEPPPVPRETPLAGRELGEGVEFRPA